jgi:nudix-type nucleoside diphosphatase (YffH/AdpP family)
MADEKRERTAGCIIALKKTYMIKDVKITDKELLAEYKSKLWKIKYEYVKKDGSRQTQSRALYDRGNGATIMLYNKDQRTVILTKQFRLPTFLNGNPGGMMIEACAGLLDEDNPQDCIIRETKEETGYEISEVKKIFQIYMSPGSVAELLHFFIASYSKEMKTSEGGGVEHEEENIDVLEMNIDDAMKMIDSGEIKDAKTIILLQYIKLHHIL